MPTLLGSIQDFARRDGFRSSREWVKRFSEQKFRKGEIPLPWDGQKINPEHPVAIARVDYARWIADCPFCGLACMVDPDDPFFFCLYCAGNSTGEAGQVRFPDNREEIEEVLLERPVVTKGRFRSFSDEQLHAVPVGAPRNWKPGQTVADLRSEAEFVMRERQGQGQPPDKGDRPETPEPPDRGDPPDREQPEPPDRGGLDESEPAQGELSIDLSE